MFGYVTAYKPELKMKDFYKYKAYYCGLCKVLREKHGFLGQLTLTYDMTFLVILLHSLYESDMNFEEHRCVVHPAKKQTAGRWPAGYIHKKYLCYIMRLPNTRQI